MLSMHNLHDPDLVPFVSSQDMKRIDKRGDYLSHRDWEIQRMS